MKHVRMMRLAGIMAMVMLLALTTAACGDEEDTVDEAIDKAVEQAEDQLGAVDEEVDACALLTQEDASDLLGGDAVEGTPDTPMALGECVWDLEVTGEDGLMESSQEVYLLVQDEIFHYVDPEWEQVDVGDGGGIDVNTAASMISVTWMQDGKSFMLTYFNIGEGMPDVSTMKGDMEDLAKKISDQV